MSTIKPENAPGLANTEQFYLMYGMRNAMIDMLESLSREGRGKMLRDERFLYCLDRLNPDSDWPERDEIFELFEDGMNTVTHLYHIEHNPQEYLE